MPAVISDASVLICLGAAGQIELLRDSYDDADGRETALQLGRDFTGTVGVLLRAKRVGKLSALKPVLDRLMQRHSFRLSRSIYEAVLRQAGEAH